MPLITLTERTKDQNDIWVNSDHIISMKWHGDYTHIRTVQAAEANPYTLSVLQHPEAIVGRIKDGYDEASQG